MTLASQQPQPWARSLWARACCGWACALVLAEAAAAPATKASQPAAAVASGSAAAAGPAGRRSRRLKGRREATDSWRLAVFREAAGAALPEIRAAPATASLAAAAPVVAGGSGIAAALPSAAATALLAPARVRPNGTSASLRKPLQSSGGLHENARPGAAAGGLNLAVVTSGDPFNPFSGPFNPFSKDPFFNPYSNPWNPYANPYVKHPFSTNLSDNSAQASEPFIRVTMDWSHNKTLNVKVDIATPNIIVSVYMLMFVPIAMAWVAMNHYGFSEKGYAIILPVTLCSMIIGQDLVNQSLSVLMASPTAITAIQALAMTIITGVWSMFAESEKPKLSLASSIPLAKWGSVALLFAVYQLVNHMVSYLCSLSERTVFLNLCPVCTMVCELTLLPKSVRMEASFTQRMSLCAMVLGALLFSLQYPDFTPSGIVAAFVLVLVLLPYRLLQRWLLVECMELSVPVLACYDGLMLLAPAWAITASKQEHFWQTWGGWLMNPSIALMLALSWMTFTGAHVCSLLMLREGSATHYLVLHNLSGFIVVFEGIAFFGDKVVQAPLVFAGITISLCSGLWYALEATGRSTFHAGEPLEGSPRP